MAGAYHFFSFAEGQKTNRGVRLHDLRDHAISELARSQASDQTIGHRSAFRLECWPLFACASGACWDALVGTTLRAPTTKAEVANRGIKRRCNTRNDTRMTVDHLSH